MLSRLYRLFHRPTRSARYLPEVDGIRFIAISLVFLLHTSSYTAAEWTGPIFMPPFWSALFGSGDKGVSLFFILSGFIIALPFARHYLADSPAIGLHSFYLRRLIRLEPPFIIAIALVAAVLIFQRPHMTGIILEHFGVKVLYLHNLVYQTWSSINSDTWSLEVELQFYLLALLLALVFRLKRRTVRSAFFLLLAVAGCLARFWFPIRYTCLYQHAYLFLLGILLADYYVTGFPKFLSGKWMAFASLLLFAFNIWLPIHSHHWATVLFPFTMAAWMGIALVNERVRRWLSMRWLALIGGMC
jgi:peptidoglycan/LPS O-acetylase OafA/YrhL